MKYRCTVCNHIHEGEFPENYTCPLCHQGPEVFEPVEE